MTIEELKKNLRYLVNKYIENKALREELLSELSGDRIGAKGMIHEITSSGLPIEQVDVQLIKDIVFNYV